MSAPTIAAISLGRARAALRPSMVDWLKPVVGPKSDGVKGVAVSSPAAPTDRGGVAGRLIYDMPVERRIIVRCVA